MRAALVSAAAAVAITVIAVAAGCGYVGRADENASASAGAQLFKDNCGSCHALKAAGTQGTVGPDLDEAFAAVVEEGWDESTVRDVVKGQIAYPVVEPPTGEPGMPANLVEGEDADAVAAFVAAAVFNPKSVEAAAGGGDGEITATDGESIFAAAGCGGCHAFSPAGTTGTTGPSLDESQVSLDEAVQQIANGGDGMPAFKDRLTEEQIRAVAEFVARG